MRSVQRAMSVLESFTPERPSLQLRQIAETIGLSDATTFRLVKALAKLGYLVRSQQQEYCLSLKVLELANRVKATLGARQVARATVIELMHQTGETVALLMKSADLRVVVDVVGPPNGLMGLVKVGEKSHLTRGAASMTLLAFQDPAEINEILKRMALTDRIDADEMRTELAKIRRRGFAFSAGEVHAGIFAIAAPIRAGDNPVEFVISIYGPKERVSPRRPELTELLLQATRTLSKAGGPY